MRMRLAGRRGEALERFWAGETDAFPALAEIGGRIVPAPSAPLPSTVLLALVADLGDAARDLGHQSGAALDRGEVLAKLDGITERVAEARTAYLAAIDGRS
jgi:hypothetical protein